MPISNLSYCLPDNLKKLITSAFMLRFYWDYFIAKLKPRKAMVIWVQTPIDVSFELDTIIFFNDIIFFFRYCVCTWTWDESKNILNVNSSDLKKMWKVQNWYQHSIVHQKFLDRCLLKATFINLLVFKSDFSVDWTFIV